MSCLRENFTSSSYGEGLETGRETTQAPRQSLTRQLFFKALKQNLRIKTFVGTSSNALQIQIWTALIALLVLKYLQLRARFGWSLSNLAALLRQQLFVYRDLFAWIDEPFQPPPQLALAPEQIPLFRSPNLDSRKANLNPLTDAEDTKCTDFLQFRTSIPANLDSSDLKTLLIPFIM
ncbi:MAG: hypothetical protein ACREP9_13235 [Candidatus Dormibacteraceae bacterium]